MTICYGLDVLFQLMFRDSLPRTKKNKETELFNVIEINNTGGVTMARKNSQLNFSRY